MVCVPRVIIRRHTHIWALMQQQEEEEEEEGPGWVSHQLLTFPLARTSRNR